MKSNKFKFSNLYVLLFCCILSSCNLTNTDDIPLQNQSSNNERQKATLIMSDIYKSIDPFSDSQSVILKKIKNTSLSYSFPPLVQTKSIRSFDSPEYLELIDKITNYLLSYDYNTFNFKIELLMDSLDKTDPNYNKYKETIEGIKLFSDIIYDNALTIQAINKIYNTDILLRTIKSPQTKVNLGSLNNGDKVPLPNGYYPHMTDPEKYYEVIETFVFVRTCSPGLIYVHKCNCCTWPDGKPKEDVWTCIMRKTADGICGAIGGAGAGGTAGTICPGLGNLTGISAGAIIGFIYSSGLYWDCF